MFVPLYLILFFALELIYFKLATRYNITDEPNHRSSHHTTIIRGGGIIFPIGVLLNAIISGFGYPYFIAGLIIISSISLYDDFKPRSNILRILCHLLAVSLMFFESGLFAQSPIVIISAYVIVIGTINAYNFMDGINGLTVAYSLVSISSLIYVNETGTYFIESDWLITTAITLVVFGFFNFRSTAKSFAGDVGSISMAFILIYFLILLILTTGEVKYIGLFLLYGLDTVTTIIFRLIRRENIFLAHRSHFYQFLVNSKLWPHTIVSLIYGVLQLIINIFILTVKLDLMSFLSLLVVAGCVVIAMRFQVEGKAALINENK